MLQLLENVQAA